MAFFFFFFFFLLRVFLDDEGECYTGFRYGFGRKFIDLAMAFFFLSFFLTSCLSFSFLHFTRDRT